MHSRRVFGYRVVVARRVWLAKIMLPVNYRRRGYQKCLFTTSTFALGVALQQAPRRPH